MRAAKATAIVPYLGGLYDAFRKEDGLASAKSSITHTEIPAFLDALAKVCRVFHTVIVPLGVNLKTLEYTGTNTGFASRLRLILFLPAVSMVVYLLTSQAVESAALTTEQLL